MKAVLLLVALSGLCFSDVSAVQCYKCEMGCNDPFDSKNVETVNCDGPCMKLKGSSGDMQFVQRGCATLGMPTEDKCQEQEEAGQEASLCICKDKLCNSGNNTKLSIALATFFLAIVHFWKYVI